MSRSVKRDPGRSQTARPRVRGTVLRNLLACAFHEASHAVAALKLGYRVRQASIAENERSQGRADWDNPVGRRRVREALERGGAADQDKAKHLVEHAIIVALVGAIGQKRHDPRSQWRYGGSGAARGEFLGKGTDDQVGLELACRLYHDQQVRDAFLRYLKARAKALVNTHWAAIERVAAALMEQQTLEEDDIKRCAMPPEVLARIERELPWPDREDRNAPRRLNDPA